MISTGLGVLGAGFWETCLGTGGKFFRLHVFPNLSVTRSVAHKHMNFKYKVFFVRITHV